jgi:hypothetical protein
MVSAFDGNKAETATILPAIRPSPPRISWRT